MSLMIYSQYTKPEGTIKFDDLVINAKKKGIKYLLKIKATVIKKEIL